MAATNRFPELEKLSDDGLIEWNEEEVTVTSLGRHFTRNIAGPFDLHLKRNNTKQSHYLARQFEDYLKLFPEERN